ncbi:Oidioi.mRNA.OKI2018_I69.PAR.g8893.t1.cds [Oikopleura dioica]|uniref:Oidioi.mRNA.OKI2018_I69.PAR.g8893.t1.cds n=1 Tax=Oikopleura dioica TaxID=34765 RepID=A0ABN7RQL2_OIKDI|nr:Oidioi.mRNA.OKI2018_I69.PAR.g8893.t1.cds [Oikopleura dioica]
MAISFLIYANFFHHQSLAIRPRSVSQKLTFEPEDYSSHFTTTEESTTSTTVDTTTAAATTSRASTTKSTTSTTSEPSENPSEPSDNRENQSSDDAEKDAQTRARPKASSPKPKKEGVDDIEHPDYPGSPRLNQGLAECPKYPDTLIGRQIPDSNLETEWDHVEETVADGLLEGGCWEPEDCFSTTKTAIIVPYKDRETHLKRLLYYLHPFLRRQKISYCIIVAEQYHDGRFNKGILMNAAFDALMKMDVGFDCVIFHDVDMLPEDDRNRYACGANPIHLSLMINKYDYRYPYGTDFGGVTMMSAQNYTMVNGHTNVFWGWGREDSDIEYRIRKQMKIEKPEVFDSARYTMCGHAHPWTFQNEKHKAHIENSYQAVTHKMLMKLKDYRNKYDGLNSLNYRMKWVKKEKLYTHLMIETRLMIPQTITMVQGGLTAIHTNYPEGGLSPPSAKCQMTEFPGASVHSNILDKYERTKAASAEKCLDIGVFCQASSQETKQTQALENKYRVRELPMLLTHPVNTALVKDCPGNLAYYQLARESFEQLDLDEKSANEVWYRDSQLFETKQVNEFTTEVSNFTAETKTNFIKWDEDNKDQVQIEVTIEVPKRIPGFYTILSKLVDIWGQPVLEFNWNFHYTSGDRAKDLQIQAQVKHDKFERMSGGKIAAIWGRTLQNAARRKGLSDLSISFDQSEKSPSEKRAANRGEI